LSSRPSRKNGSCPLVNILQGEDMIKKDFLFTSESVTEGHPDKMADKISEGGLRNHGHHRNGSNRR
jgi:hypothetical protein